MLVELRVDEGLQGPLIHWLATKLCDLDVPARTWLFHDAVPLGMEGTEHLLVCSRWPRTKYAR